MSLDIYCHDNFYLKMTYISSHQIPYEIDNNIHKAPFRPFITNNDTYWIINGVHIRLLKKPDNYLKLVNAYLLLHYSRFDRVVN